MQFDKSQILDLLRSQGEQDKAKQAEQELPDKVDTDEHSGLLSKYGIDPQKLIAHFTEGGGLGKMLGG